MRRVVFTIIIISSLASTLGIVDWRYRTNQAEYQAFVDTSKARQAIERAIRIRAATGDIVLNGRGWPETIDPEWFGDSPPLNRYVSSDHPWLEIAPPHEAELTDPEIRQALTRDVAAFWYNPASGIIRARIGPRMVDADAVDLYNRINGTNIDTLFEGGVTVQVANRAPKKKNTERSAPSILNAFNR